MSFYDYGLELAKGLKENDIEFESEAKDLLYKGQDEVHFNRLGKVSYLISLFDTACIPISKELTIACHQYICKKRNSSFIVSIALGMLGAIHDNEEIIYDDADYNYKE